MRWRALAIDAALLQLVVEIGRAAHAVADDLPVARPARAIEHLRRYRALVEQRYREQPAIAALARELAITPTQLNRACRQVLGHSALDVLHGRLLLEAQRGLAYTTRPIKQVGIGLGSRDPGCFARFFQRHTGRTPSAWRRVAAG